MEASDRGKVKKDLGYDDAPMLEQLLIQHAACEFVYGAGEKQRQILCFFMYETAARLLITQYQQLGAI